MNKQQEKEIIKRFTERFLQIDALVLYEKGTSPGYGMAKKEVLDFWLNEISLQRKALIGELQEVIADTTIEAQLNFWQKASDFQKGLIKNLKEKGIEI